MYYEYHRLTDEKPNVDMHIARGPEYELQFGVQIDHLLVVERRSSILHMR